MNPMLMNEATPVNAIGNTYLDFAILAATFVLINLYYTASQAITDVEILNLNNLDTLHNIIRDIYANIDTYSERAWDPDHIHRTFRPAQIRERYNYLVNLYRSLESIEMAHLILEHRFTELYNNNPAEFIAHYLGELEFAEHVQAFNEEHFGLGRALTWLLPYIRSLEPAIRATSLNFPFLALQMVELLI